MMVHEFDCFEVWRILKEKMRSWGREKENGKWGLSKILKY